MVEKHESTKRRVASLAAMVAVAMLPATSARAADELDMQDELSPFSLRLGVYDMNLSNEIRVDGRGGNLGTRLNFETVVEHPNHSQTARRMPVRKESRPHFWDRLGFLVAGARFALFRQPGFA